MITASIIVPLATATACIPLVKASRAPISSAVLASSGRPFATSMAPAKLSLAACMSESGNPAGIAFSICPRYTTVPILPRIAMPNAKANSPLVCKMDAADPALSSGTELITRSLERLGNGAAPMLKKIYPMTSSVRPDSTPTWVSSIQPLAEINRPVPIRRAGRIRRAIRGERNIPAIEAITPGSIYIPAWRGDIPCTS